MCPEGRGEVGDRAVHDGFQGESHAGEPGASQADAVHDGEAIRKSLFDRRLMRVSSGSNSSNTHATTTGAMARM